MTKTEREVLRTTADGGSYELPMRLLPAVERLDAAGLIDHSVDGGYIWCSLTDRGRAAAIAAGLNKREQWGLSDGRRYDAGCWVLADGGVGQRTLASLERRGLIERCADRTEFDRRWK